MTDVTPWRDSDPEGEQFGLMGVRRTFVSNKGLLATTCTFSAQSITSPLILCLAYSLDPESSDLTWSASAPKCSSGWIPEISEIPSSTQISGSLATNC